MPLNVDPEERRVTDDFYDAGRQAFAEGASCLENPYAGTGHLGRAWFAGWLDALADGTDGGNRTARAYPRLLAQDHAEFF